MRAATEIMVELVKAKVGADVIVIRRVSIDT